MNNNASLTKNQRPIRSYTLRQGRITISQQYALHAYWPLYGIDLAAMKPLNFSQLFQNTAPCVLEIGFGMGHSLLQQAKAQPKINYIGVEVHPPGIGHLLAQLHKENITNVRICRGDAVEILQLHIPDHSLSKIQIFFPDPWPKKRHHKRRLIQPEFIALLHEKLITNGILHIATDWQEYAEYILAVLNNSPWFVNQAPDDTYVVRPADRPLTKFEQRGKNLGHGVWDMIFQRK